MNKLPRFPEGGDSEKNVKPIVEWLQEVMKWRSEFVAQLEAELNELLEYDIIQGIKRPSSRNFTKYIFIEKVLEAFKE